MAENILVFIIIAAAVGGAIWAWWLESHGTKEEKKDEHI